ncbi:MAG: UDP binding domain-containing protein [Anaerolineales bacterium]
MRESPAVEVIYLLQKEGAIVRAWEPFAPNAKLEGINMAADFDSAIKDADAILLLVSHSQFRTLNPTSIATKTKARIAIDTVNAWNRKDWQSAGLLLHCLGDAKSPISSLISNLNSLILQSSITNYHLPITPSP